MAFREHDRLNLNVLLSGVVGSTAYGLAHSGSDRDVLGVYAAPTDQLLGLNPPRESFVSHRPDVTLHEVGKFCRLALGVNPTVTELLWLPDDVYETVTPAGRELLGLRFAFLSAGRVRAAYLGYALQQLRGLPKYLAAYPREREGHARKHARHLVRLVVQGFGLYATGELRVRLSDADREECLAVADAVLMAGGDGPARALMGRYEELFRTVPSPLARKPDLDRVDQWLRATRWTLGRPGEPDIERR